MKSYELRGKEVQFVIEIENATTDAVTGTTWSGNAFGTVVYTKASADNEMFEFQPTSVAVQLSGNGVIDQANNYTVVQSSTTGFIGVKGSSLQAGSIISVNGYFVKQTSDVDALAKIQFSDSPSIGYGHGGAGNALGSDLNGTKVL